MRFNLMEKVSFLETRTFEEKGEGYLRYIDVQNVLSQFDFESFLKSHDSRRAGMVAREAVEERVRMIREEIGAYQKKVNDPRFISQNGFTVAAARATIEDILDRPSLQLPASDSDTRA